ncbi:MAG: MaoC family dehydratase [Bacteroidia bacterium]|nr:MaoC family dehydratase [Bacteroidia bacterium]
MKIIKDVAELQSLVGQEIGVSEWLTITQNMIDDFARATGDFQWIHTDPEKAARFSPFGTTIAHGMLTLSLVPRFQMEIFRVEGIKMGINYGFKKVRFSSHVPVNSRIRMRAKLNSLEEYPSRSFKIYMGCTLELENSPKSVCSAESIFIIYI